MIDVLNKRRAKEEDDLEICDMDVDTVVEESVTEVSENDVSQDSQVILLSVLTWIHFYLFQGVCYG